MTRPRHRMILLLIAAPCLALALFFTLAPGKAGPLIPYDNPAAVTRGAGLYAETCAACHGATLQGQPNWRIPDADGYLPAPPHDASGHTWHHPDTHLFKVTKFGTRALVGGSYQTRMNGFGDQLDDDQILAVLAYIKSTWPDRVIARHNQINAQP